MKHLKRNLSNSIAISVSVAQNTVFVACEMNGWSAVHQAKRGRLSSPFTILQALRAEN